MIEPQVIPLILLSCLLILMISALIALAVGQRLPRVADWIVGVGLAFPLGSLVFAAHALSDDEWKVKVWLRGWVLPAAGDGALTVGVLQDRLGIMMSILALFLGAVVVMNRGAIQTNPRREKVMGSAALGVAGVILSWLSATPWLCFVGIGLTLLGGLLVQLCFWSENSEAQNAARFVWERFGGLMLSIFGTCGIVGSHAALVWGEGSHWLSGGESPSELLGALFLVLGLVLQFGAFPLNGWSISSFRARSWSRVLVAQVLPAWAAFAALFRLAPILEGSMVASSISWFLILSGILSLLCGLLQESFQGSLATWISSGFSLAAAALLFAGQRVGFSLLIAMSLGFGCFSGVCALLSQEDSSVEKSNPLTWVRIAGVLGVAAATGVPGFISSGGGVSWLIVLMASQPVMAVTVAIGLVLFAALGWRLLFTLQNRALVQSPAVASIVLPFLLVLPALGLLSTGMITGGVLPGAVDEVMPSLMNAVFESKAQEDPQFFVASVLFWGALIVGIVAAYWFCRKAPRPANPEREKFSGALLDFIASGYKIDNAAGAARRAMDWVGGRLRAWTEEDLWSHWIPLVLATPFQRVGGLASRADSWFSEASQRVVLRVTEAPARALQWIQNGDVQWYLIFSLGSGFLILLYFLRT